MLFAKERYYMRVDLRNDEMVDVKQLGQPGNGDIIVH